MASQTTRLPSRKWSIVALNSGGMATILLSYLLAVAVALACLLLPYVVFLVFPDHAAGLLATRLLISAFGLVVGCTILWSLLPQKSQFDPKGVRIDMAKEPRLAQEIKAIASALREPVPTEVYLLADANAFVTETSGLPGIGGRRIMGLGLPLMQMLSIAQFRAILAHEFGHYYAGDTRLSPWVYSTRRTMARVYQNLGKNSDLLPHLTQFAILAGLYKALMGAVRIYWLLFMRVTQAIARRQEFRSDELACHIAGSQALIDGLQGIRKCHAGLQSYWTSFVVPAAMSGYQPDLAGNFLRFMEAPQIARATAEFLAQQARITKTSPLDTHPPLSQRIEKAKLYNIPSPGAPTADDTTSQPAISLIENLAPLETGLIKKVIPAIAAADLKPMNWETVGPDIYIPAWRKQVEPFLHVMSIKRLGELPMLILDPRPVANSVPDLLWTRQNQGQRNTRALDVLFCAFALCLLDHGWKLVAQPGSLCLEKDDAKVEPNAVIGGIRAGRLSVVEWSTYRAQRGIGDWPLAASAVPPVTP